MIDFTEPHIGRNESTPELREAWTKIDTAASRAPQTLSERKRKNPPPTPASVRGRPRPRTLSITFEISSEHGPALVSAIEEISNEVGGRLEGMHKFAKEDSLTYAATALGKLRAALNKQIPRGDPDYAG